MIVQSNIRIVETMPSMPVGPIHHSEIDLQSLLSARLDAIQDELIELGCDIPADRIFLIEALGGVVDLATGMVQHEQ